MRRKCNPPNDCWKRRSRSQGFRGRAPRAAQALKRGPAGRVPSHVPRGSSRDLSAAWCHRKGRPSRSSSRPTSISRPKSVNTGAAGFNAADDDTSSSALPGRRSWHVADGGLTPWPRASKRARSAAGSKAGKPGACSYSATEAEKATGSLSRRGSSIGLLNVHTNAGNSGGGRPRGTPTSPCAGTRPGGRLGAGYELDFGARPARGTSRVCPSEMPAPRRSPNPEIQDFVRPV